MRSASPPLLYQIPYPYISRPYPYPIIRTSLSIIFAFPFFLFFLFPFLPSIFPASLLIFSVDTGNYYDERTLHASSYLTALALALIYLIHYHIIPQQHFLPLPTVSHLAFDSANHFLVHANFARSLTT
ncbi:hypothetical protein F4811DRAFT_358807 [Daldinia bambusicola]|nr:hypothetical protein F4811DRAFT_358807 [Daldinia bambusicola]